MDLNELVREGDLLTLRRSEHEHDETWTMCHAAGFEVLYVEFKADEMAYIFTVEVA